MGKTLISLKKNHMATTFSLVLSVDSHDAKRAERVLESAHAEIAKLEDMLSRFKPESAVSVLNMAPVGVKVPLSEPIFSILNLSRLIERETLGAFSPVFDELQNPIPMEHGIAWNPESVWRVSRGACVDFGAIGKGFALDRVRLLIEREGFQDFFLSSGGSSHVLKGLADDGFPWEWGWSWKRNEAGECLGIPFKHLTSDLESVGVSGTMEQGAHIRGTGRNILSSLVLHPSAAVSDALSTALWLRGDHLSDEAFEIDGAKPRFAYIDPEETLQGSPRFQDWLAATGQRLLILGLGFLGISAWADEVVDLGSMPGSMDEEFFNPYLIERNDAWILAPLLMLGFVFLHLMKSKKPEHK